MKYMSRFHFLSMTLAQTRREQTFSSDVTALSAALFSGCVFSPKVKDWKNRGTEQKRQWQPFMRNANSNNSRCRRRAAPRGGINGRSVFQGSRRRRKGRPRRPRETLLKWSDSCVWRGERWNVGHRRLEYCWNLGGFASAFPPFFPCEATASVQIFPCN